MGLVTSKSKQKHDAELSIYLNLKVKDCIETGVFTHKWQTFTSLYNLSAELV